MKIEALEMAKKAREALLAKKAVDVVILDVRKLSSVTDYYVVATGLNSPHIRALGNVVDEALAQEGVKHFRKAGSAESEWIVADYFDVVAHIFSPATRKYYELERLWSDAKVVR